MKRIVDFIKEPYFKFILVLFIFVGVIISSSDESSDTIDTRYAVDTEYLGTYFPLSPFSNAVNKNYALKIMDDKIEETITDSTGIVTQRLQSDFLKIYEIYNYHDGEQCEIFCLDKRGRIIRFIFDKYFTHEQSKIMTKSFASARKPNKKIEDLDYQELYSVYFTNDTTIYDIRPFDGGADVTRN